MKTFWEKHYNNKLVLTLWIECYSPWVCKFTLNQIVFKNKNEHSWVAFSYIMLFFSYWMGLGVYIDVVE